MRKSHFGILAACVALAAIPVTISTLSAAQAPAAAPNPLPVLAPSLPPSRVVDLTTPEGAAAFTAQWKNMDAKIVEVPAMANAGPQWKTAYDIQPHAGEGVYDDSSWPAIEPNPSHRVTVATVLTSRCSTCCTAWSAKLTTTSMALPMTSRPT